MSHTRMEDGLLRTDACFDRHSLARKFQYDDREEDFFSGADTAMRRDSDELARLHSIKSSGEYIPRYQNMYTRKLQASQEIRSVEIENDFDSLCEKGSAL